MAAIVQERTDTTEPGQNEDLIRAVHDALRRYDPIRSSDSPIHVAGSNGVVTLTGVVRSRTMKVMAEALARRVPGVAEVHNQLLTDTDIETAIALEMAMHARLREADNMIRVKSILGTVYLSGEIAAESAEAAEELKELAESIAEKTPGVVRAINSIVARERGQVVVTRAEEEVATGRSAEIEAKLAELRERRANWAERAAVRE